MTDPFSPKFGLNMGRVSAGIVTVSQREGGDSDSHSFVAGVGGEPRLINGPGEYEIADVFINGIATYGNVDSPHLNTVYVMDVDEMRVCHLGDLRQKLTPDQIEAIGAVHVLMVPVGGTSTIGPNAASEVVSQLEPNTVIPMHFRIDGTRSESLEPVDRFVREMGAKSLEPVPKLSLSAKSSAPAEIQVVLMEHRRG